MRTRTGLSTEAVYIFHNMVRKLIQTQQPEYIAAVFESAGPTFRDEAFAEYKANRTAMPEDLSPQIPWVRKTLEAMKIPIVQFPRFEADDVIGTLAKRSMAQMPTAPTTTHQSPGDAARPNSAIETQNPSSPR